MALMVLVILAGNLTMCRHCASRRHEKKGMTSRGFHNEDRLSAQSEASALRGGVMETRAWARRWSSGQPAQWQSLPPEILCRVFHHLLDKDRCAARLACSQWDQVGHRLLLYGAVEPYFKRPNLIAASERTCMQQNVQHHNAFLLNIN